MILKGIHQCRFDLRGKDMKESIIIFLWLSFLFFFCWIWPSEGFSKNLDPGYRAHYTEIISMLPLSVVEVSDVRDNYYYIPERPMDFIKACPRNRYKITSRSTLSLSPESIDCDKRVRIFRGWMAEQGYGNVLLMDAAILNEQGYKHNLIAYISLEDNAIRFIEPKERKLVPLWKSKHFIILRLIF